jgi:hypothetical protein
VSVSGDPTPPGDGPGQKTREFEIRVSRMEQGRMDAARRELLEPERRCPDCGAKLTVQVLPHGYESHCTPCERRERFATARG